MSRLKRLFRRKPRSQDTTPPPHHTDHCANHSSLSECASAVHASESQPQPQNQPPPQDLWESAFNKLSDDEQDILRPKNGSGKEVYQQPTNAINEVIESTKAKYQDYQNEGGVRIKLLSGDEIHIRQISQKILKAAFELKDLIGAGVACDPTGHAASAWTVISLGLTVGSG
jgi:hypothetical protein